MKMKMLYVRWLDSALNSRWTRVPSEDSGGLSEVKTIGFLLFEDKHHIQIAQSYDEDNSNCDSILAIPKAVIQEKRVLKYKNK